MTIQLIIDLNNVRCPKTCKIKQRPGGVQIQRCRAERRMRQVDSERYLIEPHTALVNAFGVGRSRPFTAR